MNKRLLEIIMLAGLGIIIFFYFMWRVGPSRKYDCPNNCSNHGRCIDKKCICDCNWSGDDCSKKCISNCTHKKCGDKDNCGKTCINCDEKWQTCDVSKKQCICNDILCANLGGKCNNNHCDGL